MWDDAASPAVCLVTRRGRLGWSLGEAWRLAVNFAKLPELLRKARMPRGGEARRRRTGAVVPAAWRSRWVHLSHDILEDWGVGGTRISEVAMRAPLLIVLAVVVLGTGSTLAVMNNACKSSHHAWCAPSSDIWHHTQGLGAAN